MCIAYKKLNITDKVLKTRKNFRPNLSIPSTAMALAGRAKIKNNIFKLMSSWPLYFYIPAETVISDSRKTLLGISEEQTPVSEWDPCWTT